MARELFIYWKTAAATADAAERGAALWQAELRQRFPALRAALYRRDGEPGAAAPTTVTLMETYMGEPLDAVLEQRLLVEGDARLASWLLGPRKVEAFVRCAAA